MTRRLLALLAAVLVTLSAAARPALAGTNAAAGTSGAQFLKIGAGSRAGAMGDAYSAIGDDVYSLYYNPAAATLIREPQLGAAHTAYFQGANYEVAAFAYPFSPVQGEEYSSHVLGLSIYNLSVPDIERRGTTESQSPVGTFGAGDYAYSATYAYRHDRRLGLGVTGKMIHQTIDSYSASAYAMDAGAHFTPRPDSERPVSAAFVVKNLGSRPSFAGGASDPLPMQGTLGVGWKAIPKTLKVELDASKYRDTGLFFNFGAELTRAFSDDMTGAFRFGYSGRRSGSGGMTGISAGMGIQFHRASFDFAWIPFGELGDTFRYSLLIKFGKGSAAEKAMGNARDRSARY